jgi:hypothetical protein
MAEKIHDDLEFHATKRDHDPDPWFERDAYSHTMEGAKAFLGDLPGTIDVIIWSPEGAQAYGSFEAVEQYNTDPEASVFERWIRREKGGDWQCEGMLS